MAKLVLHKVVLCTPDLVMKIVMFHEELLGMC